MNADGTGTTRLSEDPGFDGEPTWSPDGTKIAFMSARDGNQEIYVMNADGTGATRLTKHPLYDRNPAWSPDGTKIAFVSERDGIEEIYLMNADGTKATRLTEDAALDADPAWSPDGTKIAFASERDGDPEVSSTGIRLGNDVYVMNADGTGVTRLTATPAPDIIPAWSPATGASE